MIASYPCARFVNLASRSYRSTVRSMHCSTFICSTLATLPCLAGQTSSLASDSSLGANPNQSWSYGLKAAPTSGLILLSTPVTLVAGVSGWGTSGTLPSVVRSFSKATLMDGTTEYPPLTVALHPGGDCSYVSARWRRSRGCRGRRPCCTSRATDPLWRWRRRRWCRAEKRPPLPASSPYCRASSGCGFPSTHGEWDRRWMSTVSFVAVVRAKVGDDVLFDAAAYDFPAEDNLAQRFVESRSEAAARTARPCGLALSREPIP
jgi:hypothetical protein